MSASMHAGIHPLGRHPLGSHPPAQCMLGYTHPCRVHAGIDMATAVDGTHPTGMYSCFTWLLLIWTVLFNIETFRSSS